MYLINNNNDMNKKKIFAAEKRVSNDNKAATNRCKTWSHCLHKSITRTCHQQTRQASLGLQSQHMHYIRNIERTCVKCSTDNKRIIGIR